MVCFSGMKPPKALLDGVSEADVSRSECRNREYPRHFADLRCSNLPCTQTIQEFTRCGGPSLGRLKAPKLLSRLGTAIIALLPSPIETCDTKGIWCPGDLAEARLPHAI